MNNNIIPPQEEPLEAIDHVAVFVDSIPEAVAWYTAKFRCRVQYQDDTWALLGFANIRLALMAQTKHPPHIGLFRSDAGKFGTLRPHRDGTWSVYLADPGGNAVEILTREGPSQP
jgi:hypothetical protein